MRIIHGSDYYDSATYGVDKEVVFLRDGKVPEDIGFGNFPFAPKNWHEIRSRREAGKPLPALSLDYVLFAGEVYPVMRTAIQKCKDHFSGKWETKDADPCIDLLKLPSWGFSEYKFDFIYDHSEAKALFASFPDGAKQTWLASRPFEALIFEHFTTKNPRWAEWLITHGVVTGYIHSKTNSDELRNPALDWENTHASRRSTFDSQVAVHINGDFMKDLGFAKVMDPFTANQAVAQYVGGVLPANARPMVELGNMERIQKAGFDTKMSFRKAPSK